MPSKLPISNDYSPDRLRIEHHGLTLVFQGNVDHDYMNIMNPNDGRNIRRAKTGAAPTLLGSFSSSSDRWSYYKDAVLLPRHPLETDGFSGLYVVDSDASPVIETETKGNVTHIKRAPLAKTPSAPSSGGAEIISLFGAPQAD